ncbi:hypothetical protein [Conexibacter arvalis]|uniref:Zinc ribbon domain-containing protein n=1 Tax=Conexibacter arvalis TaxID=912552 RepID=A0A840IEX6_9ACTN|nr:hypothetical protein [Conexibacter arvalis]MBB4662490.1 hypothetical protein [Conexibacter arvalis]
MSGLFQRIARRRSDDSEQTSASDAGVQPPAADPAEQPTRYIGLPADAVASQPDPLRAQPPEQPAPPSMTSQQPDAGASTEPDDAATTQPDDAATTQPDALAAPDPHDAATQPDDGASTEPDEGPTTEPDDAATMQSDEGASTEPDAPGPTPLQEQPTALFPLVPEQPTELQPPLAPDAGAPVSAADAGSTPLSAGPPAAAGQAAPDHEQAAAGAPAAEGQAPVGEPSASAGQAPASGEPTAVTEQQPQPQERRPGFRERGRMRRRLRYLRRLRELQVRDLGGLAFDLRRFERKRDDLIAQKIDQIRACDDELRALESALDERRDIRDVRMPGVGGTCPRCFSLYGSNDRYCAHCGAALGGLAQGPAQVAAPPPPPAPPAGAPSTPTAPPPTQ